MKINEILTSRTQNAIEPEIELEQMRQLTRTDPSVQLNSNPRSGGQSIST